METNEYIELFKNEIAQLNSAAALRKSARAAWNAAYESDAADEIAEPLADAMGEASNEYERLEHSLRVKSEKTIGRGKPLGDFWETIYKMRKAESK